MKKIYILAFGVLLLYSISSCAYWKPIPLDKGFWQEKGRRVGVALLTIPSAEVQINVTPLSMGTHTSPYIIGETWWDHPGYSGWPMILHEARPLDYASKDLDAREFTAVLDLFLKGLKGRGFDAFMMEQSIDEKSLPRFNGKNGDGVYECRDFRDIGKSVGADYIILLGIKDYGTICRYVDLNNYDVEVFAQLKGFLVNTSTNRVMWRMGVSEAYFSRQVNALCSRPDHIPVIIDELKALIKDAAEDTSRKFFGEGSPLPPS